jgi:hypothetical protein
VDIGMQHCIHYLINFTEQNPLFLKWAYGKFAVVKEFTEQWGYGVSSENL